MNEPIDYRGLDIQVRYLHQDYAYVSVHCDYPIYVRHFLAENELQIYVGDTLAYYKEALVNVNRVEVRVAFVESCNMLYGVVEYDYEEGFMKLKFFKLV